MYRLSTQFGSRSQTTVASAAAGGSCTCSTSSCCIVTLGAASVLTAKHFSKIAKREEATPDTNVFEPKRFTTKTSTQWAVLGFFMPLVSDTLLFVGLFFKNISLGIFLALIQYVGSFVLLHKHFKKDTAAGFGIGFFAVVLICVASVIEALGWIWLISVL
jgi:hypothetical protein